MIQFRLMRADDRHAVTTLCAQMWDGHDYIPQVFDDWLAHPRGQFTAVIDDDRDALIGIGKLTSITERDWWIEGLRIDPAYRGQGMGRRLHAYHVDLWQQISPPTSSLRLLTDHDNHIIQRFSEQAGFRLLGEVVPYRAEAIHAPHSFRKSDTVDFSLVERSHYYQTHQHLYQTQTLWRWAELTPQALSQREVWLWREGRGVIIVEVATADNPLNVPCVFVDFVGAAESELVDYLKEARGLAASLNHSEIGLGLLLSDSILIEALIAAGYSPAWTEESLFLYERRR